MEIARIAERTVIAVATAASKVNTSVIEAPAINTTSIVDSAPPIVSAIDSTENKFWMWMSIILASGWLLTVLYMLSRRKPKQIIVSDNSKDIKLKEIIHNLKKACSENNAIAAKNALIAWGKVHYNSETLSTIAPHCEARLRDEILLLNQNLYASQTEPWQGKKLFQTFTENKAREKVAKKIDDALEPLYKLS